MASPNGKTILVVEDEAPLRKALADILLLEGFNVLLASDGKQGLETAIKYEPDLILLDLVMPNMNGWEMLDRLRTNSAWGNAVPVYLLTNIDDKESAGKMVTGTNIDYFVKSNWILEDVVLRVKGRLGLI
jgi:DNA-binding response OmpR family regulator